MSAPALDVTIGEAECEDVSENHLYPREELESGLLLGVKVLSYCGAVRSDPFEPTDTLDIVADPNGRLWAVPEESDCRACIEEYEALLAGALS